MDNDSSLVRARHLEALAQAAKDYTLAELADITLSGSSSYSLPTASSTVKGGVKIGDGLSMNGDTLNVTLTAGESYTLPTASSTVKGGVKVGTGLAMNGDSINASIAAATTTASGLMSAADKTKLNGIATGANNFTYTLPTASTSTKGGVIIGDGLEMDGDTLNCTVSGGGTTETIVLLGQLPTTSVTTVGGMWLDVSGRYDTGADAITLSTVPSYEDGAMWISVNGM